MRVVSVQIYQFGELSEETKQKAVAQYLSRYEDTEDYDAHMKSFVAFCAVFDTRVLWWRITPFGKSQLKTNSHASDFRSSRIVNLAAPKQPPTSKLDAVLWGTYAEQVAAGVPFSRSYQRAITKAVHVWKKVMESDITASGRWYTRDGQLYTEEIQNDEL